MGAVAVCDVEVSFDGCEGCAARREERDDDGGDDHPGARAHDGLVVRVTVVVTVSPALT